MRLIKKLFLLVTELAFLFFGCLFSIGFALELYSTGHKSAPVVFIVAFSHDAAIEEFRTALRLDPQSTDAHLGLGHSLEKKGELHDALQEYSAALPVEEARTKYEKLSAKLGIKKDEPQTKLGEKPDIN